MQNNNLDITISLSMTMFLLSIVILLSFTAFGIVIMYKKLKELIEEVQRDRYLLCQLLQENSTRTVNFSGKGNWRLPNGNLRSGNVDQNTDHHTREAYTWINDFTKDCYTDVDQNAADNTREKHTEINDLIKDFNTDQLTELSDPTGRIHKLKKNRVFDSDTSNEDYNGAHRALQMPDQAKEWNRKTLRSDDRGFAYQLLQRMMRVVHQPGFFFQFFFGVFEKQLSIQIIFLELFILRLGLQRLINLEVIRFFIRARYHLLSERRIKEILACMVPANTRQNVPAYSIKMQDTSKFLHFCDLSVILDKRDTHQKIEGTLKKLTAFEKSLFQKPDGFLAWRSTAYMIFPSQQGSIQCYPSIVEMRVPDIEQSPPSIMSINRLSTSNINDTGTDTIVMSLSLENYKILLGDQFLRVESIPDDVTVGLQVGSNNDIRSGFNSEFKETNDGDYGGKSIKSASLSTNLRKSSKDKGLGAKHSESTVHDPNSETEMKAENGESFEYTTYGQHLNKAMNETGPSVAQTNDGNRTENEELQNSNESLFHDLFSMNTTLVRVSAGLSVVLLATSNTLTIQIGEKSTLDRNLYKRERYIRMELVILPLVAKISVIVKSKDIFSCLVALDCRCAQAFATHFLNWKNIKCLFGVQDDLMVKDTLMAPTTPSKVKDRGCYRNLPLIIRSDMYGDHHSDVTSETTSFNFHVASYTPVNAGAVDFFYLSKDGFYYAGEDNVPGPMKSIMPKTNDYSGKIPNFIIPWFDGEECFTESNGKMTPMADDNPEVTAICTMECSNDVENPCELARVFPGERAQPVGKRKEIREFPFANKMANECRLGTPIVDSRQ